MKLVKAVAILVLCGSLPAMAEDVRKDDPPILYPTAPPPPAVAQRGLPAFDSDIIVIMLQQQQSLIAMQSLLAQMLAVQMDTANAINRLREEGAKK